MVEYLRLTKGDSFLHLPHDWHRPETLVLVGIFAAVIAMVYFVLMRK